MIKNILLIALILELGCENRAKVDSVINKPNIEIINLRNINDENPAYAIELKDIITSVNYIPLETNSKILIDELVDIGNQYLRVTDNYLVLNSLLFNKSGKYIRTIGRQGNGPGEYLAIRDVTIDDEGKRVFIYDHWKHNVLCYSFDGNFQQSIKDSMVTYQSGFSYVDKNKLLFYSADRLPHVIIKQLNMESKRTVNLLDSDFSSTLPGDKKFYFPPPPHWKTYLYDSTVHFRIEFPANIEESDYIYTCKDDVLLPKYKLEMGDLKPKIPLPTLTARSPYGSVHVIGESSNYLFLRYIIIQKEAVKWLNITYDKKHKIIYQIDPLNKNDKLTNLILARMAIKDDSLFSYVFPYELNNESMNSLGQLFDLKNGLSDELSTIYKRLDENDNPIIVISKIK